MKVFLINPGIDDRRRLVGRYAGHMVPVLPQGIAYIAAALLEDGHEVAVHDQFATRATHREVAGIAARFGADLVGLSTLTALEDETVSLVRRLKERTPGAKIVLGNIHASVLGAECLAETGADVVVHGEGEDTMRELARAFECGGDLSTVRGITFESGGEYVRTPPRPPREDLDSLPFPAWHLFDLAGYPSPPFLHASKPIIPVIITRGCPHHCTFCSQTHIFTGRVRTRKITLVVDEIEEAHRRHGANHFGLNDAIFPYTQEQAFEFADEIRRRDLHRRIRWFTEMRVDIVTRPMLRAMKDSGLYLIMLGIESGADPVLLRARKRQSVAQISEAVRLIAAEGILTFGLFVIGLPGENRGTALETIRFARDLPLTFAKFNRAVPYPGSELYDEWHARHVAGGGNPVPWNAFSAWAPPNEADLAKYIPDGMTADELRALQDLAVRRFYLKPSRMLHLASRGLLRARDLLAGGQTIAGSLVDRAARIRLPRGRLRRIV